MADFIIVPRRREDWFNDRGDLTLRALRFFESLTNASNDSSVSLEEIAEIQTISGARAVSQASIFNQQDQHNSSDVRIEALEVRPQSSQASIAKQQQQVNDLGDRLDDVEVDLSARPRTPDIFRVNQRIDELIDELTEQLKKLNVGSEAQQQTVCLQVETLKQMRLLNARTEEAFNTKINEGDIQ